MTSTHYCEWFETGRGLVKALCGVYIRRTAHANDPTCVDCRAGLRRKAENDAAIAAVAEAPADPSTVVPFVPFDPCADYRPRDGK